MNKTNKILIGSVSALCIVGTLTLLKAVFPGAEYGSVSDWVSAGSTFGTLIVALIALKKAPDWINQKKHEDAYSLSKNLFLEQLPTLSTAISKIETSARSFQVHIDYSFGDIERIVNKSECNKNINLIIDARNILNDINFKINQLEMLGWSLKEESKQIIEYFNNCFNKIDFIWSFTCFCIDNNLIPTDVTKRKEDWSESVSSVSESVRRFYSSFSILKKSHSNFDAHFHKPVLKK